MPKAQAKEESVLWEVILEVTMKESVSNAVSEPVIHPNTRELGNRHQTALSDLVHTHRYCWSYGQVHSVPKRPLDGRPVECLSFFSLTWTRASKAQKQPHLSELRDDRPTGLKNGYSLVILTQELSNFWPQIRMGRVGRRQNALSHRFNGWSVSQRVRLISLPGLHPGSASASITGNKRQSASCLSPVSFVTHTMCVSCPV